MCSHQLRSGLLRRRLLFRRPTLCLFSADKAALTCVALCTSHELCLNGKVSTVTLWSHGKGNHSPAAVPASTPGTFCDPLSINCSCEGNMFLRWMWLKKQAAIPYCVSRSCHMFLLRKRETVWLATRNTDHCSIEDRSLLQACWQLLRCTCLLTLTTYFTAAVRLSSASGAALGGASASVQCRSTGSTDLPQICALTLSAGVSGCCTVHTGNCVTLVLHIVYIKQVFLCRGDMICLVHHSEEDWPQTPARNTAFQWMCSLVWPDL